MAAPVHETLRGVMSLVLLIGFGVGERPLAAQAAGSVTVEQFVGAWELADWRASDASGNVRFPYGENAVGQIAYSANGRMSAHLMRPPERQGDPPGQHLSYWGGFSLDTGAGTVTHHVIGSTVPGFIGTDLVRQYTFEGEDRLVLRAGDNRLTWERVR